MSLDENPHIGFNARLYMERTTRAVVHLRPGSSVGRAGD
jgi:hypothetical protein